MRLLDKIQNRHFLTANKWSIFYLLYLVFYFVPWPSTRPTWTDIGIAVLVLGAYIPVHFLASQAVRGDGKGNLFFIVLIEAFAVITAPFNAGNGVFHVYAASWVGFQKNFMVSVTLFLTLTAIYVLASYSFGRNVFEIFFIIFMAGMVWVSGLQGAHQVALQKQKERERELENQHASITERERIARDLHDLLGHTLTMVSLKSDLALKLIDKDLAAARGEIDEIRTSTREALSDIRAVLHGMNHTSIGAEIANAKRSLKSAKIALNIQGQVPYLVVEQEQVAALAIREAVTNIIRHSNAAQVTLTFSKDPKATTILIEDNGSGSENSLGRGLRGLKDRVAQIGGSTAIDFGQGSFGQGNFGKGTRVSLTIPTPAALQ